MKIEFETKEDFLLDMLEYYSEDPECRRCKTINRSCSYSSETISKDTSEGCAIGRVIEPSLAREFDENMSGTGVSESVIFDELPEWLQNLGQKFLISIQVLHDLGHNWITEGLSPSGIKKLTNIIAKYQLKKELFNNYLN